MTEPNFPEFFFVLNDGIMDQKLRPFEFFEKFDGYFLLKLYYNKNFYYLLVFEQEIPYLGKNSLQRYKPKCYLPINLQNFLINHISKKINEIA